MGIPLVVGRVSLSREEADDFARRLLAQECTEAELAAALEVHVTDVTRWRVKFDPYTDEEKARYATLADKIGRGACQQLAMTLGVSVHTVYGWRRPVNPDATRKHRGGGAGRCGGAPGYGAEVREQALVMLREGRTRDEVAAHLGGLHPMTLTRWAAEAGVKLSNGRPRVSDRDRAIIVADARRLGVAEAAALHKVSGSAIYNWIQAAPKQ